MDYTLLTRNIFCLIIMITSSHQTFGMKRSAGFPLESTSPSKKACPGVSENPLIIDDANTLELINDLLNYPESEYFACIKKAIFSFDPVTVNKLISTEQAHQLTHKERTDLHKN